MNKITSRLNPQIKHVAALHHVKYRQKYQQFIGQGVRTCIALCRAAPQGSPPALVHLYATKDHLEHTQPLTHSSEQITIVSDPVMEKISTLSSPPGLVGVFKLPPQKAVTDLTPPSLVLANVCDPGNMGTLIRTAAAVGVQSVVCIQGADPWSPKVVQASAGSNASVHLYTCSWDTLKSHAERNQYELAALVVQGGVSPAQLDPHTTLLVVGNEAHGIPDAWTRDCNQLITIPMPGKIESLNAAVAGSVALYLMIL